MHLPRRLFVILSLPLALACGKSLGAEAAPAKGLTQQLAVLTGCYVSAQALGLKAQADQYQKLGERSAIELRHTRGEDLTFDEGVAHFRTSVVDSSPATYRQYLSDRCSGQY